MDKVAILHIGLFKTGTTSFQAVLSDNRRRLRRRGYDFYRGVVRRDNHGELFRACMRADMENFSSLANPGEDRAALRRQVRAQISEFVVGSPADQLVFSAEALSLLRTHEEVEALRALFPVGMRFRIVVVLRDKQAWLASYERQIRKVPGREPSENSASALYVGPGEWLTDFEGLIDVYSDVFGGVTTLEYRREGMLYALLAAIGIDLPIKEHHYVKNDYDRGRGLKRTGELALSKLYRAWVKYAPFG